MFTKQNFRASALAIALVAAGLQFISPANATPLASADIRLLPAEKNTAVDAADVSAWYQPDVLSPAYLKYVKAGSSLTLEYIATAAGGAAIANAPVTLNINNKGGGETAIWTKSDGTALASATNGDYVQQLTGTTDSQGHVTFTVRNENSDAQSESVRSVLNEWSASANGKELKGGFYPTLGATVEHVDRFWPHIVSSGTGGGTGVAPGSGGGSGGSGGQSCAAFGDASAICAPISQMSVTPTGSNQALAVSGGQTILTAAMTSLKLAFTSNSGNAGKNLAIQFFDLSPGLGLSLQTSEAGSSTTCRAAEAVGNMCFITADSAGSANFTVSVTGVQIGRFFKFQINGPAGFTSGFITATYATSISGGDTADLCADRTRICASVSRVSFDVAGSRVPVAYDSAGAGSALMPVGTTAATFRYTSAADYAGKFVHIQFFDLTAGLELTVPSGVANSSTSCDPGPAPARGCYLQLDSSGAASFNVALTGVVAERFFRYQISGAGGFISQSVTVTVRNTVVVPCVTAKVLVGSSSVSATTGTSTKVTFTVVDAAGKPCEAKAVSFSATGWGSLGALSAFTDGAGQVSVTVQSDAATTDKSMVVKAGSLNAKKATVSASTTVKWAKIPTPPAATVTTARGLIKVVVTSAAGMTVTISYSGASTGTKSFDVTAKSATLSVAAVKGSYTVTVKIGSYVLVKTVSVS